MAKKTKIVTLEGTTDLTNADIVRFFNRACKEEHGEGQPYFKLTQKPRVQVAQPVKAKR